MESLSITPLLIILLWSSLLFIFYSNLGYLLILRLATFFLKKPVHKLDITPSLSLMIAAHNEENVIAAKLENCLALDYPKDRLQIIVASDASDDRTNEIVRRYAPRGVLLNSVQDGMGKVFALNVSLPLATGEILAISDADSEYQPDALHKLVRNFADPHVGAVTGEEVRLAANSGKGAGEGLYVRLDNQIKRLEGVIGSVVMVNGGFFAIRRDLYPILDPHLIHDSIIPCRLQLTGYRTAYEPEAVSYETYVLDAREDFRRRLRTVIQAFYSYLSEPRALNPFRTGFFAFEVLSHRFSRWFVFPFLWLALGANIYLAAQGDFYQWLLIFQLFCYGLAATGFLLEHIGIRIKLFHLPYYFIYIHLAAFWAVLQGLSGKRMATWRPTERNNPNR